MDPLGGDSRWCVDVRWGCHGHEWHSPGAAGPSSRHTPGSERAPRPRVRGNDLSRIPMAGSRMQGRPPESTNSTWHPPATTPTREPPRRPCARSRGRPIWHDLATSSRCTKATTTNEWTRHAQDCQPNGVWCSRRHRVSESIFEAPKSSHSGNRRALGSGVPSCQKRSSTRRTHSVWRSGMVGSGARIGATTPQTSSSMVLPVRGRGSRGGPTPNAP